jgi:hypothetical protein
MRSTRKTGVTYPSRPRVTPKPIPAPFLEARNGDSFPFPQPARVDLSPAEADGGGEDDAGRLRGVTVDDMVSRTR